MRAIKSRDTAPEIAVRRIAASVCRGYRLNRSDIAGKPDIAWIGLKRAVFVHGCFWHGHDCARGARIPKSNRAHWIEKIARNRARDAHNAAKLRRQGWRILVLWECQLRDAENVRARLVRLTGTPSR